MASVWGELKRRNVVKVTIYDCQVLWRSRPGRRVTLTVNDSQLLAAVSTTEVNGRGK